MTDFSVSVRDLVAFCHRSGDIDFRFRPSPTAVQGVEGHQRVYRERPESYRPEYACELRLPNGLHIRGRADGYDQERGLVEEIKTCRVNPDVIPEAVTRQHLAQARIYAAMIAQSESLNALTVRLTWFHIDEEREYRVEQDYLAEELTAFLNSTLAQFSRWLELLRGVRRDRDASLEALAFPYGEFRAGQRDIAELVYKCVDQAGQLMVEAPTGIGKTAAVLFPALKALGRGKHERIAFLTAKSVGRKTAEDTLERFAEAGYRGRALSLTARDKICLSPGKACHGDDCPYAAGYYDKLGPALFAALEQPLLSRDVLESLGREYDVCPYQLGTDLLPWIDVVIGDLHHLYGMPALLGSLLETRGERWSALLDEAHNLPGRARGMYSATLAKKNLMAARRSGSKALRRPLDRINRVLLALGREDWQEPDFSSQVDIPSALPEALRLFVSDCADLQARDATVLHRDRSVLDLFFAILHFLRVAEDWGEDFRFEMSRSEGKQSLELKLNCMDPARLLAQRNAGLRSITAFSATLSPIQWVRAGLGFGEEAVYRRESSPFASEALQVDVARHIDTRYRGRQQSIGMLASLIVDWLADNEGNCIVYFPSYQYMNDCIDAMGLDALPGRTPWVQARAQDESQRNALLQLLAERRDVVAFCILGGVFGEGIDLPGEQLQGVVIVGVGLPQVNRDTEQLRQYYQARYGQGFEYAYLYPGMQKVDQALGRVIRTAGDTGRALLIDDRYRQRQYRDLLPPWWSYTIIPR